MKAVFRPMARMSRRSMLRTSIAVGLFALGAARSAHAQALDDEVVRLLSNNCEGLSFLQSDPNLFGVHLQGICSSPQTTGGASSGGGAASPQASALSIQNSVVQQRLERARRKKKDGEGKDTASALDFFRNRLGNAELEASPEAPDAGSGPGGASRRFSLFVSGGYESLDRKVTRFEDGYQSSITGGAVGFDYQFTDSVVGGLVAGYRVHKGDFDTGGDFEMKSFEPSVYLSVLPSSSTFLQFVAGYGNDDSDSSRAVDFTVVRDPSDTNPTNLSGIASSANGATVYSGGAQFGYDHAAGSFTFGPRIGANYSRTTVDSYEETGGTGLELRIDERTVKSLQGVAGFYGGWAVSTNAGVVVPQFNVEYVHEFEDQASIVTAQFAEDLRGADATTFTYQTNVPDADFFNVEAGVAAVFNNGIQPFINVRVMLGNENFDSLAGTLGVRFEF